MGGYEKIFGRRFAPIMPEDRRSADEFFQGHVIGVRVVYFSKTSSCVVAECRMPNAECRMPNAECRMPNAECRMPNAELLLVIDNERQRCGPIPA
jgi:hypothetical protein